MKMPNGNEAKVKRLSDAQLFFLNTTAYDNLNNTKNTEMLKHFADTWWNLCLWEKQRADVLDGKAQMLLGILGLGSPVIALLGTSGKSYPTGSLWLLISAAVLILLGAILAMLAIRISNYGGFLDRDVFGALTVAYTRPANMQAFRDTDPYRAYLRDVSMQRWLICNTYKIASHEKANKIHAAQLTAFLGICLLLFAVVSSKWPI